METRKRRSNRRGRLWAAALAATLACALLLGGVAQAAPATGAPIVPNEASPKPVVTIQGNIVVDKGKPTGFYELALCVRTARIVRDKTTKVVVADQVYVDALNAAAEGDEDALPNFFAAYEVQRFPFQSAAATVHIDLDALTAVTWGAGKPVYDDWIPAAGASKGSGTYVNKNTGYPRGLDLSGAVEQPDIFTDLDKIINGTAASVRLDTANPDEMTNATALIEGYDAANNTALLTLSANTTNTANVVYDVDTPVVVVRFAYDLERFRETDVLTQPNQSDFWLGLDRNDPSTTGPNATGQRALTFLGRGSMGDYSDSDAQAAAASIHQTVWYTHNLLNDQVGQSSTNFYSYLGAETFADQGTGTYTIIDNNAVVTPAPSLTVPKTQGNAVLAKHSDDWLTTGEPDAVQSYSFFQNLLTMKEGTLKLELVNAETYRKPAGGGGTTILFYDWDDSLIGSLVVDKGDIRAEVNSYVEKNMVHPDLRASQYLKNGKVPELTDPNRANYENLLNSLERQYTYRGKYPFEVGGSQTQNDPSDTSVLDGSEYPLTNKLDYAFYRRINRVTEDVAADHAQTNYYSTSSLLEEQNLDAALYPYAYCWAVVEDTSELNQSRWQVRRDATKLENTWTTVGVGELADMKPGVGRTDTAIPAAAGTQTVVEPAFIAAETEKNPVPPPTDYQFTTASTAANRYLRFADFSDIDAELERYQKETGGRKDTLIVKAVYEPGESLLVGYSYRLAKAPYYNKLNSYASTKGAAYSVELEMERSDESLGQLQGVSRMRVPTLRQDTTADNKWLEDDRIPDHDADNAGVDIAKDKSQTAYVQAQMVDGDTVTATLSLSARHNKVDFFLIEGYGKNFVAGGQRSGSNFERPIDMQIVDNYNYYSKDSDTKDQYLDIQNFTDKDGSHGFVLYGTLNCMMEQATRYVEEKLDSDGLALYIDMLNLLDTNLRSNATGAQPTVGTTTSMRNKICNAARECITHKGDPRYWNSEKECAQLTFHQLQYYILGQGLLDPDTAEDNAHKLGWCHLHADCAATVSNKPKNWGELIEKAKNNEVDDIKGLLLDELQTMTRLRANLNGAEYTDRDLMVDDIVAAVQAGCESWDDIQYYLIYRIVPTLPEQKEEGPKRYWWSDGVKDLVVPTDLPTLLNIVKQATGPPAVLPPDGSTTPRTSKLYGLKAIVEANAAQPGETITGQWRRLTHNLVADADENGAPVRFTSYEQFIDALIDAVKKRPTLTGASRADWDALQRLILEAAAAPNEPTTTDYYWYDGARRITSLPELIAAAQDYHKGDTSLWDSMTQTMFTNFADPAKDPFWYFADAFEMTRFLDFTVEADYNAFLKVFLDWVATPGADLGNTLDTTWAELQYMITHGGVLDRTGARNEFYGGFFWWKGGVTTPPTYDLSTVQGIMDDAAKAAFAAKVNGNAGAWDSLDQAALDSLNLRYLTDADANAWGFDNLTGTPKPNGNTTVDADHNTRDAMPKVTAEQFKTAMEGMVQSYLDAQVAAGNGHGHDVPPAMSVYEMQYAIINNGGYQRESDMPQVAVGAYSEINGYWWLTTEEAPNKWSPPKVDVPVPAEWTAFVAKLAANPDASKMTVSDFKSVKMSINGGKEAYPSAKTLAGAKKKLAIAAKGILDAGGKVEDLTWYEIEYSIVTGLYAPNIQATKHSQKDTWNTWAPEWVIQKWDPDYVAP